MPCQLFIAKPYKQSTRRQFLLGPVGNMEWAVRRMGIITGQVWHVTFAVDTGLVCPCQLYAECAIACQHMRTVCRVTRALYHMLDCSSGCIPDKNRFNTGYRFNTGQIPVAFRVPAWYRNDAGSIT
jgi:hypothetical protein